MADKALTLAVDCFVNEDLTVMTSTPSEKAITEITSAPTRWSPTLNLERFGLLTSDCISCLAIATPLRFAH